MLGVVEPMSCGIGGDLCAMIWEAKTGKLHGLNASGRAPRAATIEAVARRGVSELPLTGPLSWSVPGAVDGWQVLRARFGTMDLGALLAPAIATAEQGFPVSDVIAAMWRASEPRLREDPGAASTLLVGGRAPRSGEVFRNPTLARSYRDIAQQGPDAFYRGRIAREIVAFSKRIGGLFEEDDFATTAATWVEPVSTSYRGLDVWELPPPGQGISVLQMLNMLEGDDLASLGPLSPDFWHLVVEVKKLAYADRSRYYADPEFARVPVAELISKKYAAQRRRTIDPRRAAVGVPPGGPFRSDTVYISVVDEQRNCVSLIQSIFHGFGSGVVPPGLGFPLHNRGSQFSLDPAHPNRLEPRKRPFHTILPAMATREGKPRFVFGVMGADMQPQGQVQVLVNLLDFGMNVQAAGEAPRIEHVGSATPTGRPEAERGGLVLAEEGIPDAVVRELANRGHQIERTVRNGGGYQGVLVDWDEGALHGGSEWRSDGCAAGY
jgi:gamma-glutamyltranspeptidase/glutathione hydrolase